MIDKSVLRLFFGFAALTALPLALSACDTMDDDDDIVSDQPAPQNVQETPPGVQAESIPFISDPQAQIWKPGYWAMVDGQFVWVHGRVIARPAPTAVWATAHWTHHTYGWSFEEGHWE